MEGWRFLDKHSMAWTSAFKSSASLSMTGGSQCFRGKETFSFAKDARRFSGSCNSTLAQQIRSLKSELSVCQMPCLFLCGAALRKHGKGGLLVQQGPVVVGDLDGALPPPLGLGLHPLCQDLHPAGAILCLEDLNKWQEGYMRACYPPYHWSSSPPPSLAPLPPGPANLSCNPPIL